MDYRHNIIKDVESTLINTFPSETVSIISGILTKILNNYEVTERVTDIVPLDSYNERIIRRYCGCLMVDGKSNGTIYQYKRSIQKLSDFLHKPFNEMGIYDIRFYLACEKENGISARSLENIRANLSAFFQWLTNEEIIPKNPIASIKQLKYPKEIKKPFSDVEIDIIRSSCKTKKERAIVEVLLSTGVRVSELSNMRVCDIDFRELSVHVKHSKGGHERITYISNVGIKHLQDYLTTRKENGEYLFYNKNHQRLASGGIRHILKTISERSGVDNIHPHRFRRTFATNASKKNLGVQEIQKLLGHSSINTTMEYICVDDEIIKSSYRRCIA